MFKRNQISDLVRHDLSRHIFTRLQACDWVDEAETIFLYAPLKGEIEILSAFIDMGKRVAVPRVIGSGVMGFYHISSIDELVLGTYGILEPRVGLETLRPGEQDLMIIPGVGYDLLGYRLGYGGGFYDRYLETFKPSRTIGVCFESCLVEALPVNEYDQKVKMIVTEKRSILIN